ncbi:MAG: hypothetical protein ACI4AK_08150 [Lepagella sp.]
MRKQLLLCAVALTSVVGLFAAAPKVSVTPLGDYPTDRPNRSVTKADVIVNENFEAFTAGSPDAPDWDNKLCVGYGYGDDAIDPALTHDAQWHGHHVCQAGGMAALYNINPQYPSYINTPMMDYSGSIKVSFLAKALKTSWVDQDENGALTTLTRTNSTLTLSLTSNDRKTFDFGDSDIDGYYGTITSFPLYHNQGWCEITVEFDNYSAYNDAFFQIASAGHALIDDIKITQSIDKFIATPVFKGFTGATDDSFTVSFEPVRKSFNYYLYLYELVGYEDDGSPIYKTVMPYSAFFSPEELEELEAMGITPEEYFQMLAEEYGMSVEELIEMLIPEKPYNNVGIVETEVGKDLYSFTYSDLDPNKQYYFDIRSHNFYSFSPENILPVDVIGTPVNLPATNVTSSAFTANWEPISKAEGYYVDLYGANKAEDDTEDFVIFEEDFDATYNLTDATDIFNPEATGADSDIVFDDLTSSPGWDFADDFILLVQGMAGLDVDVWGSFLLTSPALYVWNSDMAKISLRIESTIDNYSFYVRFANKIYQVDVEGSVFENEIVLPTYGLSETTLGISGPNEAPIFIDYISVSQDLKAGQFAYTWLGRSETDKESTSYDFEELDKDAFGYYAFRASAFKGEGDNRLVSFDNGRMVVDLNSGSSEFANDPEIIAADQLVEVERYTLDGTRISAPVKGVNIIRYNDGSTRKVIVK